VLGGGGGGARLSFPTKFCAFPDKEFAALTGSGGNRRIFGKIKKKRTAFCYLFFRNKKRALKLSHKGLSGQKKFCAQAAGTQY